LTTPPRRPSPASRATRRSRRPAARSTTFLERNRNRLLWAIGGLAALIVLGLAFANVATPAYACSNLFNPTAGPTWTPPPTPAPSKSGQPAATEPPPGFVQPDMGNTHVAPGTRVNYQNCPPASGKHYNAAGVGPIDARLYGPDEPTVPEGWVHNLEHGALVLLYKCPGPSCDDAGQAALRALLAKWPLSPICGIPAGNQTPVFTRFDDMETPYMALVWDVVLPMQSIDEALLFKFYAGQAERFNPEKRCAAPTATPGPVPTARPTGTAAPSATPSAAPSGSASPAASAPPATSAPAASTAPPAN
jgi:hypothetical protein